MKKTFKISIIEYKVSNLKSVSNALNFLEINNEITHDPKILLASDAAILPGVGSFSEGMKNLNDLNQSNYYCSLFHLPIYIQKNLKEY